MLGVALIAAIIDSSKSSNTHGPNLWFKASASFSPVPLVLEKILPPIGTGKR